MSSYGYNITFIGWRGREGAQGVLRTLLASEVTLPSLTEGDWMEEYDEPPALDPIHKQLKAWHRTHKKLPRLTLKVISPAMDAARVYLLALQVPLCIENSSDGPEDLGAVSLSMKKLDASIAAAERLAAATGLTPSLLHLSSDDPK